MPGLFRSQFRALGRRELPSTMELDGESYRLERAFKHGFMAAVGLYRGPGGRIVCKFHRSAGFFGVPLCWLGRMAAGHESRVLRRIGDLEGVPRFRGRPDPWTVARDFVPGRPIHRDTAVNDEFFPRFLRLLHEVHGRGVACVDLEKARNILLGEDGRPYLIDWQTAYFLPARFLGETTPARFVRGRLQRADTYHAMKHYRRMRPDRLTDEQIARTRRKPLSVRLGNAIVGPYKKLRRWLLAG